MELFTIGHSTHEIERFRELLRGAGIEAVAVRRCQCSGTLPR